MKWFRPRPETAATAAPEAGSPRAHGSLALPVLLSELHPDRRLRILDLGPAVGANISFWSERFPCTVQVVDLWSALAGGRGEGGPDVAAALPEPPADTPPVDVVLAWDLLNYLDRDRIRALADRLSRLCGAGAHLFAMLLTGPQIPREPGSYPILDGGRQLLYRVDAAATRPGPRYRPADIDSLCRGFATDRNFLLRHGVQEYLLLREEDTVVG